MMAADKWRNELERLCTKISAANGANDQRRASELNEVLRIALDADSTLRAVEADAKGLNLRGLRLQDTALLGIDFSSSDISNGDFSGTKLPNAKFVGCILDSTAFIGSTLEDADFSNAKITKADFRGASLIGVKGFGSASISGAMIDETQAVDVAISIFGEAATRRMVGKEGLDKLIGRLEGRGFSVERLQNAQLRQALREIEQMDLTRGNTRRMVQQAFGKIGAGEQPFIPTVVGGGKGRQTR